MFYNIINEYGHFCQFIASLRNKSIPQGCKRIFVSCNILIYLKSLTYNPQSNLERKEIDKTM